MSDMGLRRRSARPTALDQSSRPEAAFVLLLLQSTFWLTAGMSAFPFVLAGEAWMLALGLASFVLACVGYLLAVGLVRRSRRSRRLTLALEVVCLLGSALLFSVPIGTNRGVVSLMVNIVLPVAVIALLRGKRMRTTFFRAS
jgi:hypothetical protein